jgi:hypothetical protein
VCCEAQENAQSGSAQRSGADERQQPAPRVPARCAVAGRGAAKVHDGAVADAITDLVLGHGRADIGDLPDDLVAGYDREGLRPQSPLTVWMSEWQIPAYWILMRTSSGPTSRRSMVVGASGGGQSVWSGYLFLARCTSSASARAWVESSSTRARSLA